MQFDREIKENIGIERQHHVLKNNKIELRLLVSEYRLDAYNTVVLETAKVLM